MDAMRLALDATLAVAPFAFRTAGAIAFGRGSRDRIAGVAAGLGRRVLLVTGARSLAASGELDRAMDRLRAEGLDVITWPVLGEPDVDAVDRGAEMANEGGVQVVVAIGGGSVLDAAKAVAVVVANGGSAIDYLEDLPGAGGRRIHVAPLPLVAVPTTAGTGAEVTRNAVLRVPQFALKRSMRDDRMLPSVAIVDPDLTARSPRDVVVSAALDALAHLMESYVSLGAQPMTDLFALHGACRAFSALRALAQGQDEAGIWDELALASLWGGMALANAGLGAVHGLAAPLCGRCAVPHGAACATLLAPTIRINVRALRARSKEHPALARYAVLSTAIARSEDPLRLADEVDELRRRLGARPLAAFADVATNVSAIVAGGRGGSMKYNPIALTDAELESILIAAIGDGDLHPPRDPSSPHWQR
ncbi:MAG: iron-containing alcohol dehydrogenase [Myxococcota bacterium]|nr:iron-containing alcohol dehydrogenase [Myxococcota bacterium]